MSDLHIESRDSTDDERYAYGENDICGVGCPAVRAGLDPDPNDEINQVMGHYDTYARLLVSGIDESDVPGFKTLDHHLHDSGTPHRGVVAPETARKAWERAIDDAGSAVAREAAEHVARELGWANE